MVMNNFSTSLDFNLSDLLKGKEGKNKQGASENTAVRPDQALYGGSGQTAQTAPPQENTGKLIDDYGYAVFNVPWSLNISYGLNYTKSVF